MIAHVVVLKRGTLRLSYFDYQVPAELEKKVRVGQLVTIPLRTRVEYGIVLAIDATSDSAQLKTLLSIAIFSPLLTPDHLAFLQEISDLYHVSLGFLVKNNVLPLKKRKIAALGKLKPSFKTRQEKRFTKPTSFIYTNDDDKQAYLQKIIKKNQQTLILVPEINDCPAMTAAVEKLFPDSSVVITSDVSEKDLFDRWVAIWTNKKTIIIGTRGAFFLPFNKLGSIIIDNEGHDGHKSWDMAPRYHAKDAAFFLAKYHGSVVHLLSHTPSVETYYFTEHHVYDSSNHSVKPFEHKKYSLLYLSGERRGGNLSGLGTDLLEAIRTRTGTVFLFCHRRGTMSYVCCRDCQHVITCPNCQRSLTYHRPTHDSRCHHCGYREPMKAQCQKCGGVNLALYGIGTDAVVNELKKQLPNDTRPIVVIDQDSGDVVIPDGDCIFVGTQFAWRYIPWNAISVMAIVDADTPLFVPEYRTVERLWLQLRDIFYRLPDHADFFIQTNHPEHVVFTSLGEPPLVYKQEIAQRKLVKYPPFRYLVRLSYGHSEEAVVKAETKKAYDILSRLTKDNADCTITSPYWLMPTFQKGRYWQAILVKLPYSAYKKIWRQMVTLLPDSWKVDPNPLSIFTL